MTKMNYQEAKRRLDRVFSEFVRLRDCKDGKGRCISCNRRIVADMCDAGHFVRRKILVTRWNEHNVNGQCITCNQFEDGCEDKQAIGIDRRYGAGTTQRLIIIANTMKSRMKAVDLVEMAERYEKKVKEMRIHESIRKNNEASR